MGDKEYGLHVGEPYLARDWNGKLVVLREETLFSTGDSGRIVGVHITEALVNPDPSDAEIFKHKLKDKHIRECNVLACSPEEDS